MLKLDKSITFFPEFSILGSCGQTGWKYVVFQIKWINRFHVA